MRVGELPNNLDQVMERAKDIQYSSKTRFNTNRVKELEGSARWRSAACSRNCRRNSAMIRTTSCSRRSRSTSARSRSCTSSTGGWTSHERQGLRIFARHRQRAVGSRARRRAPHAGPSRLAQGLQCRGRHARLRPVVLTAPTGVPMTEDEVRANAYAMPLTNPAFPRGPYRFVNREFFIITYRTDPDALRAVIPAPLEFTEPLVKYEFIRMPDSTGFGDYTESRQVIPVTFRRQSRRLRARDVSGRRGADRRRPRAVGLSQEACRADADRRKRYADRGAATTVPSRVAVATMGYKHRALDVDTDCRHRWRRRTTCSRSFRTSTARRASANSCATSARTSPSRARGKGPAALELFHHALAPVAAAAGARGGLGRAHPDRPDARTRHRHSRLSRRNDWRNASMKLKDKFAIITGAASGIGKEIALTFAREGAKVAIADLNRTRPTRRPRRSTRAAARRSASRWTSPTKRRSTTASRRSSTAFGGVDILVSNAGIQIVHPLEEFTYADWKKMLAIHVDGAFLTTRACLPHMYKSGRGGSVIYMGSVHSKEASMLKAPYVTAKHGLIGLAKVVAKEGAAARRARQRDLSRASCARRWSRSRSPSRPRSSASPRTTSSRRSC